MDSVWADGLNIQLISCFTKDISAVNKPLMRKGRLNAKYYFKDLIAEKT